MDQVFMKASRQRRIDEVRAQIMHLQDQLISLSRYLNRVVLEAPNDDRLCAWLDKLAETIRFEAESINQLRFASWSSSLLGRVETVSTTFKWVRKQLNEIVQNNQINTELQSA